jgi:hypothetical protein
MPVGTGTVDGGGGTTSSVGGGDVGASGTVVGTVGGTGVDSGTVVLVVVVEGSGVGGSVVVVVPGVEVVVGADAVVVVDGGASHSISTVNPVEETSSAHRLSVTVSPAVTHPLVMDGAVAARSTGVSRITTPPVTSVALFSWVLRLFAWPSVKRHVWPAAPVGSVNV